MDAEFLKISLHKDIMLLCVIAFIGSVIAVTGCLEHGFILVRSTANMMASLACF